MPDFLKGTYCTPDMFDGTEAYVSIPASNDHEIQHHLGASYGVTRRTTGQPVECKS